MPENFRQIIPQKGLRIKLPRLEETGKGKCVVKLSAR